MTLNAPTGLCCFVGVAFSSFESSVEEKRDGNSRRGWGLDTD